MGNLYCTFSLKHLFLIIATFSFSISLAQRLNINENGIQQRSEVSSQKLQNDKFFSESNRARTFKLNKSFNSSTALGKGKKIEMELFHDKKFETTVLNQITDINGVTVITLKLDEFKFAYGYLTISDRSHLLSVQIPELNEKYLTRYHPASNQSYLLSLNPTKQKGLESCGVTEIKTLKTQNPFRSVPNNADKEPMKSEPVEKVTVGEPLPVNYCRTPDGVDQVVIDIMVVYSDEAKVFADEHEGGINNTIATALANANNISLNSELGIFFNLVYSGPANYSDSSGNSGEHLNSLRVDGDGYMDNIHPQREEVGADIVAMFTFNGSTGGMAYLLTDIFGEPEYAFSLTNIRYASNSNVFAHEIGHNLGAMHNKYQIVQQGPTEWENWEENTWSAGWRWTGDDGNMYTSVMSYPQGDYYEDNINSVQVPYFSDSNSLYLGGRIGNEFEGDNTRTLKETKYVVSDYSDSFEYCLAGSSNYEAASIDHVILGDIDNFSGSLGYSDYSGITTCLHPQETKDLQVAVSGPSEAKELLVWADWNDNKIFDGSELVYQSFEKLTNYSIPIQVPSNTTPGVKRLRIRLHDTEFGANSTPCGESEMGEVEDYAINILEPTPCTLSSRPENLVLKNLQSNGFELSWSPIDGISNYEVRYKKTGDASWTNISGIYYANYEFTGLTSETQYEVQVRSSCSATEYSEYSETVIATTNPALAEIIFSEVIPDGEAGVSLPRLAIHILDSYGNLSNSNARVELNLIDHYSTGAELKGYLPARAKNGVVVFEDLRIDKLGPYAIEAMVEGLPPVRSNEFNIRQYSTRTFTVNTTDDTNDSDLKDNICADLNGNCSLRAAIQNANSTSGKDIISFNIPGEGEHRIMPAKLLPKIKYPVDMDATSQPGYAYNNPKIIVSGENIPVIDHDENLPVIPRNEQATCFDLVYQSSGSSIRGFVLGGFGRKYEDVYHSGSGIVFSSTTNQTIQANFIGVDSDGITAFPNIWGIIVGEPENMTGNNLIGGPDPEDRNIISGNIRDGIHIGYYGSETRVVGNYIGTDKTGNSPLGNDKGVSIGVWAHDNILDGNVISGNNTGVEIRTDYNKLVNNYIGTNATGNDTIPNSTGIYLSGNYNTIGLPGEGNLISGNRNSGILIYGESNILNANIVGADLSGTVSLANSAGISISGNKNEIGGASVGSGNSIVGNKQVGIRVDGNFNKILGNNIGTSTDNLSIINGQIGILISGSDNIIGSINLNERNIISNNANAGIILGWGTVLNNKISGNQIYGNSIGIDLNYDGKTRNDRGDADTGANKLQNYPDLSGASSNGSTLEISYVLDSEPTNSAYPITVEVFRSAGNEQGSEYLGAFIIEEYIVLKGNKVHTGQVPVKSASNLIDGDLIVTTATDANGNTSEFSNEVLLTVTGSCTTETFYADTDGDGLGDASNSVEECSPPVGYVSNSDDCDDNDPAIGALQTWFRDYDDDGFGDPLISKENCVQESGYVADNTDCDDNNPLIYPGALDDSVDGIDQDCDGTDGPVTSCQGTDFLQVTETCSTSTNIYWQITNPSICEVAGRWELRKTASSGASSGTFSLKGGQSVEVVSGTISKGKTQIVVVWDDSNGIEISTSQNASGIECSGAQASMMTTSASELVISPNPIDETGIGIYFTEPVNEGLLQIRIYSSSGNLVYQEDRFVAERTNSISLEVDHSLWLEGVYIMNADLNGSLYQTQFIK